MLRASAKQRESTIMRTAALTGSQLFSGSPMPCQTSEARSQEISIREGYYQPCLHSLQALSQGTVSCISKQSEDIHAERHRVALQWIHRLQCLLPVCFASMYTTVSFWCPGRHHEHDIFYGRHGARKHQLLQNLASCQIAHQAHRACNVYWPANVASLDSKHTGSSRRSWCWCSGAGHAQTQTQREHILPEMQVLTKITSKHCKRLAQMLRSGDAPVAQNVQPIWQPTWDETHSVERWRPASGCPTSISSPSPPASLPTAEPKSTSSAQPTRALSVASKGVSLWQTCVYILCLDTCTDQQAGVQRAKAQAQ